MWYFSTKTLKIVFLCTVFVGDHGYAAVFCSRIDSLYFCLKLFL